MGVEGVGWGIERPEGGLSNAGGQSDVGHV